MKMTIWKTALGMLLLGGLSLGVVATAHAGCCGGGGGGYRGGYGGGHTFGRTYYAGYGGGCGCSMNMAGMQMPTGSMQDMHMGGYAYPQAPVAAAPAAATAPVSSIGTGNRSRQRYTSSFSGATSPKSARIPSNSSWTGRISNLLRTI